METSKEVRIDDAETIIIASDLGQQSIRVSKMKINLSSPMPFVECTGELSILSDGLYGVTVTFDELGEYIYKVEFGTDIEYLKVKVVEMTNTDMIKDILEDINYKIEKYDKDDDQVFDDILRYLKIINARI